MAPNAYIISVSTSGNNRKVIPTVLGIAGRGEPFYVSTNEARSTHLFLIPAVNKSVQYLTTELQEVPGFNNISVVGISQPVQGSEFVQVREALTTADLDASKVSDDQLSLFLAAKLQGAYTYYIDRDHRQNEKGLFNMHIRRLEEHPKFSPGWFKDTGGKKQEIQDRQSAHDVIEVRHVLVETEFEVNEPPPPPPNNLDQLSDGEIRNWLTQNDPRNLKDDDIEITRTSEEIAITIKLSGVRESVYYQLKK